MCKIMIMAGIKKENSSKAAAFTKVMGRLMSQSNNDGLGYAAMDSEGKIFGQRWLYNNTAWMNKAPVDEQQLRIANKFKGLKALPKPESFETTSFGKINNDAVAIILHTRMATTEKGMSNTHPFVTTDNKVALIHNGIINNHKQFDCKLSTCDSEAILVSYLNNKVIGDINNIQKVADELRGYYACGILSNTGVPTLDVFRANGANLTLAFVKELDTFVFTTSGSDITSACQQLGFTHEKLEVMNDETILRLNPMTGDGVDVVEFKAATRFEYTPPRYQDNYPRYEGAKEYVHEAPVKKGMTAGMIRYLQASPKLEKLSTMEMQELIFSKGS